MECKSQITQPMPAFGSLRGGGSSVLTAQPCRRNICCCRFCHRSRRRVGRASHSRWASPSPASCTHCSPPATRAASSLTPPSHRNHQQFKFWAIGAAQPGKPHRNHEYIQFWAMLFYSLLPHFFQTLTPKYSERIKISRYLI